MPFTPDNDLDLLFPEELVPQHIKDELPPELHVRPPIHLSAIAPSLPLPSRPSPSFPFPMSSPSVYLLMSDTSGMLLHLH